ncbi:MAG: ACT domain-containing protein, partial [Candidatus Angelobacter sp.]
PGTGTIQEIGLRYSGRITEWKTYLIRNAAIQGILNHRVAERANVVNAAAIAQERGIQIHESPKDQLSGADVIAVSLRTSSDERAVRGGVLRGNSLRLLGVNEVNIEIPLEGNLIYIRNRDVPGVVGKIGTILGQHNLNIGNFALGRNGKEAVAVVQVDTPAPEPVLEELRKLAEIEQVCGMKTSS